MLRADEGLSIAKQVDESLPCLDEWFSSSMRRATTNNQQPTNQPTNNETTNNINFQRKKTHPRERLEHRGTDLQPRLWHNGPGRLSASGKIRLRRGGGTAMVAQNGVDVPG